jgi:hypothetical protein
MFKMDRPVSEALTIFTGYLETKTPEEKTFLLLGIYQEVFGKVNDIYFKHGLQSIKNYHLFKDFLFKLSEKDALRVFKTEMTFLKTLSSKASFPSHICRLLLKNYIENIEGRSTEGIPGIKDDELLSTAKELYATSRTELDFTKGKISESDLEHILRKPFYSIDLKYLILNAEDPAGRKSLSRFINQGLDDEPYKYSKRQRLSSLIEKYIFLSHHFGLKEDIEQLQKKTMPIRDQRVFEILEIETDLDKTSIYNELRKVFDPFYSPAKSY